MNGFPAAASPNDVPNINTMAARSKGPLASSARQNRGNLRPSGARGSAAPGFRSAHPGYKLHQITLRPQFLRRHHRDDRVRGEAAIVLQLFEAAWVGIESWSAFIRRASVGWAKRSVPTFVSYHVRGSGG